MRDLTVEAEEHRSVIVLRLAGHLFLPDSSALMAHLTGSLTDHRHSSVVCDLSELSGAASDWALTVFPASLRRVGGWPYSSLRLAGAGPALSGQLERMRMWRYLPVHRRVDDAVRHAVRDADLRPHDLPMEPDPVHLRRLRNTVGDLWPHPTRHGLQETQLVADELAANAICHVGEPFLVSVAFRPSQTLVAVTDPSRSEPVAVPSSATTSRRGMHVVDRLSQEWGVWLVHGAGKTVWAMLPAPGTSATPRVPRTRVAAR